MPRQPRLLLPILVFCLTAAIAVAETYDERLFQAMEYRLVGPFRGGRVTAVAGVPGRPRSFYMGSTGGGVWKTTDGGIRWRNVSDKVVELDPPPVPEMPTVTVRVRATETATTPTRP